MLVGARGDRPHDFRARALRQLNPLSSRVSPLRYFSDSRVEGYYRRTVNDASLAAGWRDHYLRGLTLESGAAVLDHGCGRGRHIGLLTQLGFLVAAQDVRTAPWWARVHACAFQAVPAEAPRLPWRDCSFDAMLDVNVVHHLDSAQLTTLAAEAFRVLKPGGCWLLLEANADSYGARAPRKYYGRLHTIEDVRRVTADRGFMEIDRSYEGFYSPVLPQLVNFLRKQAWPGPFEIEDFDSRLAAATPARRRALWLLRLRKPQRNG